ncbi:MAG: trehalose-phosphatase [Thalassobaculales bacterium]
MSLSRMFPAPPPRVAPDRTAFLLDFDGTLAELAPRPEEARLAPPVVALLRGLHARADGALALISGRPIAELDARTAPLHLPAAGQHGAERRAADGRLHEGEVAAADLEVIVAALGALAERHPALLLERKRHGAALHYRGVPGLEAELRGAVAGLLAGLGGRFVAQPGKMVIEVRPACADKGRAVRAFMAEAPFRGRQPLFAGDDVTDEDGFAAVNALAGISVKIGEGATAARYRLPDVPSFVAWLGGLDGLDGLSAGAGVGP